MRKSLENREGKGKGLVVLAVTFVAIALLVGWWAAMSPRRHATTPSTTDVDTYAVTPTSTQNTSDSEELRSQITNLGEYYIGQRHSFIDQYWLRGDEGVEEHIKKVFAFSERLKKLLKENADISDLTKDIADEFADFNVSEYVNGASQILSQTPQPQGGQDPREFAIERMKLLELCVMPPAQIEPNAPSALFYRRDWKAMMAPATQMPRAWLAALAFHELGHALADKRGEASALASPESELYVKEEVKMHSVEQAVLDRATDGRLARLFDRILTRADSHNWKKVLQAVTTTDLDVFDQILGTEGAGRTMANIYLAQFVLGVSFYAINQTVNGEEERNKAKMEAYRLLRSFASP